MLSIIDYSKKASLINEAFFILRLTKLLGLLSGHFAQ